MPACMSSGPPARPPDPVVPNDQRPKRRKITGLLVLTLGLVCCFLYFPFGLVVGLLFIMAGGVRIFTDGNDEGNQAA